MNTKEERIVEAKKMLQALGLKPEDLLEENSPQVTPQFLDIQKINGVPCMYLCYDENTKKNEWLCLEISNKPMNWYCGKKWCQSKGGDYGKITLLEFISERREKINLILEKNGYPLIEEGCYWSIKNDNGVAWAIFIGIGKSFYNYIAKSNLYQVRAVITTD